MNPLDWKTRTSIGFLGRTVNTLFEWTLSMQRFSPLLSQNRLVVAHGAKISLLVLVSFITLSTPAKCDDGIPRVSKLLVEDSKSLTDKAKLHAEASALFHERNRFLQAGKIEQAIEPQQKLMAVVEKLEGESHWKTKNEQAFLEELQNVIGLLGSQQSIYLAAGKSLQVGGQHISRGDFDNSNELLSEALENFTSVLGENTLSVGTTLERLGQLHILQQNPKVAKDYLIRNARVQEAVVGKSHPSYASAVSLMGTAHLLAKEYEQAEPYFREAAVRMRKLFGPNSFQYVDMLAKLSNVMLELKMLPEAEAMCLQAIATIEKSQGQHSPLIAHHLFNLANVYIAYEDNEIASATLKRSILLFELSLPPSSPVILKALKRQTELLQKLKRFDEARAVKAKLAAIHKQAGSQKN